MNIILKRCLYTGLISSLGTGFMVNKRINIRYINKNRKFNQNSFIIGTFILPIIVITYPIFIVDSYFSLCIIDKFIDNINEKYDIDIKRYHQHDGVTKYYSNSLIFIDITKKYNL
jgi:hypothetical protein